MDPQPAAEPVVEFALRTFAFGLFLRPGRAASPDDDPPPDAPEDGEGAAGEEEGRWEAVRVPAEIAGAPGFTTLACRRHCCLGITPEGDVHRWDAAGRGAGVLACGFGVEWSLLVLKDEAGQRVQLRDVGIGYPGPGGGRSAPASSSTSPARSQTGSRHGQGSAPCSPSSSQPASPPHAARAEEAASPTSPAAAGGGGAPQDGGGGAAAEPLGQATASALAGGQQPRARAVGAIALMDSGEVYTTDVFHSGAATDGAAPAECPSWRAVSSLQSHLVVAVCCGASFCLALTGQGELWAWGESDCGSLGLGRGRGGGGAQAARQRSLEPAPLRGELLGLRVAAVACGDSHVVAATFDEGPRPGSVYSWGRGCDCRLGYEVHDAEGADAAQAEPRLVPWITASLGDCLLQRREHGDRLPAVAGGQRPSTKRQPQRITQLGCGSRHSVVLCRGGVVCFGANSHGQLGRPHGHGRMIWSDESGGAMELPAFASVPALADLAPERGGGPSELAARRLSCGPLHTAAVASDGSLHVWGLAASALRPRQEGAAASPSGVLRVAGFGASRPVVTLACGAHFVVASAEVELAPPGQEAEDGLHGLLVDALGSGGGEGPGSSAWRPADLPPKDEAEATRHKQLVRELERSIQQRLEREERQGQQRRAREERRERRLQEHTEIWLRELLPSFVPGTRPTRRMEKLWRQGLPPRVREVLWPMAIGNVLRITPELFEIHKQQALDARRAEAAAATNVLITLSDPPRSHGRERSIECIPFDLPRTFPTLAFFCEGGPLHEDCARILEAYTFFRPDIGYVQGMSFLAAVLLLYLPPYPAFVGLCNLLNSPSVLGLYRLEPGCVECRAEVFRQLCAAQMPAVARVIEQAGLRPEMFLIEWFMTLYSKCLPIDVASVIWDLFLLDGEVVLYCAGLALLRVSEQELLAEGGADLEGCARILGEELRERANDPDELLWQLSEAERRAPPQLLAEIRGIENAEFGSTPLPVRAGAPGTVAVAAGGAGTPGASGSIGASPGTGALAGAAAPPLQRGLAAVSALRDSIVSRWR